MSLSDHRALPQTRWSWWSTIVALEIFWQILILRSTSSGRSHDRTSSAANFDHADYWKQSSLSFIKSAIVVLSSFPVRSLLTSTKEVIWCFGSNPLSTTTARRCLERNSCDVSRHLGASVSHNLGLQPRFKVHSLKETQSHKRKTTKTETEKRY